MTDTTRSMLRHSLAAGYAKLRQRLAHRLGSDSFAGDVLHETWVRLGQGGDLGPVVNPEAYIFRTAIRTASRMRGSEARGPASVQLDEILDVVDETPGPARIVESQEEVRRIAKALDELAERPRDVFLSCFLDGQPTEAIAERHGVSVRTIQADLRIATIHCARRLGRKDLLADRAFRVSRK